MQPQDRPSWPPPSWLPQCGAQHCWQNQRCRSPAAPAGCSPSCTHVPSPPVLLCACLQLLQPSPAASGWPLCMRKNSNKQDEHCALHGPNLVCCSSLAQEVPQGIRDGVRHGDSNQSRPFQGCNCIVPLHIKGLSKLLQPAEASPAGNRLSVHSRVSQAPVSVGAPCVQLAIGGHSRCMVLRRGHHCDGLAPWDGHWSGKDDCALTTVDVELGVPCTCTGEGVGQASCMIPVRG